MNQKNVLQTVLQSDIDRIQKTLAGIDEEAFALAIKTILKARRVYVIGMRSSAPLAEFFSFYMNLVRDNVVLVKSNGSSEVFEQMLHVSEKDVVIGISFPRYSMRTLKALEFANSRQAKVITITDEVHSPLNLYSSCNLIAKSSMTTVVDSLVAPMSVINALIVGLCMKKQNTVISNLENLEAVWEEYQVFTKDEIDLAKEEVSFEYE